jgi:hypothetical protein
MFLQTLVSTYVSIWHHNPKEHHCHLAGFYAIYMITVFLTSILSFNLQFLRKAKVKLSCYCHVGDEAESSCSSYSFLTSALDGGECSASRPSHTLTLGKDPGTHWVGGWVGLRAGLNTETRGKTFASVRDETLAIESVVRHYID